MPPKSKSITHKRWPCTTVGCHSRFTSQYHRDQHIYYKHTVPTPIQNFINQVGPSAYQARHDEGRPPSANGGDAQELGEPLEYVPPTRTEYHPRLDGALKHPYFCLTRPEPFQEHRVMSTDMTSQKTPAPQAPKTRTNPVIPTNPSSRGASLS